MLPQASRIRFKPAARICAGEVKESGPQDFVWSDTSVLCNPNQKHILAAKLIVSSMCSPWR
jgi:hypothetical protein